MNEFETRINALRLHYKAERMQIQQECDNYFTRINKLIAEADDADIRRALRAEKNRVYHLTRNSIYWSTKQYRQQLALANAEYEAHLERVPSRRAVRRAMSLLDRHADAIGTKNFGVDFGDGRHGEVILS